jgi:hypothetical protein
VSCNWTVWNDFLEPLCVFVFGNNISNTGAGIAQSVWRGATVWTAGVRFCFIPQRPDWVWVSHSLLSNGYRGLFPRGKVAGAWSWPHLHVVSRSRMVRLYLHSTHVFMARCLINYPFLFTLYWYYALVTETICISLHKSVFVLFHFLELCSFRLFSGVNFPVLIFLYFASRATFLMVLT